MNHLIPMLTSLVAESTPLLADSAIKATALLLLASVAALMLRRDSASRRHLIWLLAIVALLTVPVLSTLLPKWRVLPHWAEISPKTTALAPNPPAIRIPDDSPIESPQQTSPTQTQPPATISAPVAEFPISQPTTVSPKTAATPVASTWTWSRILPAFWAIGFILLILRLLAARLLLVNSQRRTTPIDPSTDAHILSSLKAAQLQLNLRRPMTLLLHPDKTIPVVFGIFKPRLLLPQSARDWNSDQLKSVFLHELAHVKRRDMLIQLLTQIACALHWFNPLAWLAAWRIGVERERACDDLVLASGVRPSTYATHLLDAVTTLSPNRWTHACGLAMARKSSIEGRLLAVLSKNQNRRRVSLALAIIALALATVIAIPVAMLRAADAKPAAETAAKAADKLNPAIEEKVKWSETVNGLRAALVIRALPDASGAATPDIYLLVQNVSDAPIHFSDTIAEGNVRYLTVHRDQLPQGRTKIDVPTGGDAILQPRQATYLQMCPREKTSRGLSLAAGMLKEPHMFLTAQIEIEKAPQGAWTGKIATPLANAAVAQIDENAAAKPGPEQNLNWGKPVNGLRAAIALRPFADQPKPGDVPELYIAVQNVSNAPIRLNDSLAEKQPRMLHLYIDHRIVAGIGAKDPRLGDRTLKPQEITFVQMYGSGTMADKKTIGQLMAEDILKDTHQSMVAHFLIETAPEGAWTGELVTAEATGAVAAGQPQPKTKEAQALMATWQHHARLNGLFPGGHIERLGDKLKEFIHNNTGDAAGDPYAKKMAPLLERIDSSRDWKPAEVAALFDDIAAVTPVPLETTLEQINEQTLKPGQPLPPKLARAPWGQTHASGLRTAYILEPAAAEYPLGTALNARILIHNAGKNTVVFRARSWHQLSHSATDANGKAIKVEATEWLTRGILTVFRLEPGEFVELNTPGIGVGAMKGPGNWQNTRVGSWLDTKPGDDVTVTTSPLPLQDWNEPAAKPGDQPAWWLDLITAKLNQDQPILADPQERQRIVYRAGMELFGTPLDAKTIESFVSDKDPNAVERLAKRLASRQGVEPFSGDLTSAPTTFRVLPFDPNAQKTPAIIPVAPAPEKTPAASPAK